MAASSVHLCGQRAAGVPLFDELLRGEASPHLLQPAECQAGKVTCTNNVPSERGIQLLSNTLSVVVL